MSLFEILDNKHEKLSEFCDLYVSVHTENNSAPNTVQKCVSSLQLSAVQL